MNARHEIDLLKAELRADDDDDDLQTLDSRCRAGIMAGTQDKLTDLLPGFSDIDIGRLARALNATSDEGRQP